MFHPNYKLFNITSAWALTYLTLGMPSSTIAQQIVPEVVFRLERLPLDQREFLQNLQPQLSQVISDYSWTEGAYNYPLPVRVEIYFESYSTEGVDRRFKAGILVALRSGIQLRDSRWDFRIKSGDRLHLGEPYDSFTSLIEFYIWICLGFEHDKISLLGGNPYYERARLLGDQSQFESRYYLGWDYRRELAADLALEKYKIMRRASFHAAAGGYYIEQGDIESAAAHLNRAGELLLTTSPDLPELARDDHKIRFIDMESYIDALYQVEALKLIDKLAAWDKENEQRYR